MAFLHGVLESMARIEVGKGPGGMGKRNYDDSHSSDTGCREGGINC